MVGVSDSASSAVKSLFNSSIVQGALLPTRLAMKAGEMTVGRFLGLPVVVIKHGRHLLFQAAKQPDNELAGRWNITPIAVCNFVGGLVGISCASPIIIVFTPISTVGGVIFGLLFRKKGDRRELVGIAAVNAGDKKLEVDQGIQELLGVLGNDQQSMIQVPVKFREFKNSQEQPFYITQDQIQQLIISLQKMEVSLEEAGGLFNDIKELIQRLDIREIEDLLKVLNAYPAFLALKRFEKNMNFRFTLDHFEELMNKGLLRVNSWLVNDAAYTVDEIQDADHGRFRDLAELNAQQLQIRRRQYIARIIGELERNQ